MNPTAELKGQGNKMKTVTITVSTKKGESQTLRWLVVQQVPHPDISSDGGRLRWRNAGGLFSRYGAKAEGIGSMFCCYLLASDVADVPKDYNRTHFAGFVAYNGDKTPKPGTMKIRGNDLGEMIVSFGNNPQWPEISVRCGDRPTPSERKTIEELIVPKLREFIEANKADLRQEAISTVKKAMADKVAEARAEIDKLAAEIETATF